LCCQSSLIDDVRAVVTEKTSNGVGVATNQRYGHDNNSKRFAAGSANSRDAVGAFAMSPSGNSRDTASSEEPGMSWLRTQKSVSLLCKVS